MARLHCHPGHSTGPLQPRPRPAESQAAALFQDYLNTGSTMELPPWVPGPENTHAGRILAIARCIFDRHVRVENHREKGPVKTFDNMCSGDLEKSSEVLNLAGFTEYIDDIGRRSVFICEPEDFEVIAGSQRVLSTDPDLTAEAVLRLARGPCFSSEEIKYLAEQLDGQR